MNTEPDSISQLAYGSVDLPSKLMLFFYGGIGVLVWNFITLRWRKAFIASASNFAAVAGTCQAHGCIETDLFKKEWLAWKLLGITALACGAGAFAAAFLLSKVYPPFVKSDTDFDVMAAYLLKLGFASTAHRFVKDGFQHYPESSYLIRRNMECLIKLRDYAGLEEAYYNLHLEFRLVNDPHLKARLCKTIIEYWKFIGDDLMVEQFLREVKKSKKEAKTKT